MGICATYTELLITVWVPLIWIDYLVHTLSDNKGAHYGDVVHFSALEFEASGGRVDSKR